MESFVESSIKLASLVLPANSLPRQKLRKSSTRPLLAFRLNAIFCRRLTKHSMSSLIAMTDLLGREVVALRLESIDALI
jgi:hypothetical protein